MKNRVFKGAPAFLRWLLVRLSFHDIKYSVTGDFEEIYKNIYAESGRIKAVTWYATQILRSIPVFVISFFQRSSIMLKNYLKITLRNFFNHKVFSLINLSGLTIGMICSILIMLWIRDEFSFDRFHENADEIYRVLVEKHSAGQIMMEVEAPNVLGPVLKGDFPEVIEYTRFGGGWRGWNLKFGENDFSNERIAFADPSFFKMFTFPFLSGDKETALEDKNSVIITEEFANKCFGDIDPVGKILQVVGRPFKVTGVISRIPDNSHIQFDYICPASNLETWLRQDPQSWGRSAVITYLQLQKNSSGNELEDKISGIIEDHDPGSNKIVSLQSLKDVHLRSGDYWDQQNQNKGNIVYVYMFSIIGIIILLVSCINYMNLSTARSFNRAKEVGLRKVVGARKKNIIIQFFGESIFLSVISLIIALLTVELVLPAFNEFSGKKLILDLAGDTGLLFTLLSITLLTGILSGSYPSLFISSFQPINIIKNSFAGSSGSNRLIRKILVITQFVFTVILVIGTVTIYKQLQYVQNENRGYNGNDVIYFPAFGRYSSHFQESRGELLQNPDIIKVSRTMPPFEVHKQRNPDFNWDGKEAGEQVLLCPVPVDYYSLETFGYELVEGRFFSKEFSSDAANFVINETAAEIMGFKSPLGKQITYKGDQGIYPKNGEIIGVVKDFHLSSFYERIPPVILYYNPQAFSVCVKIDPDKIADTIPFLEEKWGEFVPGYSFSYYFVDQFIDGLYDNDRKFGNIVRYFAFLSVFLSCLGLFGLSLFIAEQRMKEVGIRKAIGASIPNIISLLSKEYISMVFVSNIFAWPLGYFALENWLRNFEYRISFTPEIFILAGVFTLSITLLTVIYQSIKTALQNPVDSLKYE
ncbi:MAG: FtsX-like permease family protein [bacterium]|nr:FtsX-like permease family protein [bacterium]